MPPRKPKPPKPPTPKKVNPWDAPSAKTGDSSEDDIFKAVGRVITDWEFVEESLARIFAALVGTVTRPRPGPAVRAYGSIVGFKARLDMIRAAGETFFQMSCAPGMQSDFDALMNECFEWSNRRNDIAHGRVWASSYGHLLFPALYSTKKYKPAQPPAYSYSSKEIATLSAAFQDLYDRLESLAGDLEAWNRKWSQQPPSRPAARPRETDQET